MLVETSVETAAHSDDVGLIAGAICTQMGIGARQCQDVLAAARLHDIGKSAVPREVLEKPAPLDAAEWREMRRHTIVGERILSSVQELKGIARLVRHSHERWDGDGYPDGLAGEEIPLGSRIIFCADAFHAVRSDRPYRRGSPARAALEEVKRCAGTQFDPTVVAALEQVAAELKLVPPARRARRSSRLTALLLVLALGAGGSAVGRSGLLGPVPSGSGGNTAGGLAPCPGGDCSIFGPLLGIQLEGLGLSVPGANLGEADSVSSLGGFGVAGVERPGNGARKRSNRKPKSSSVAAPVVTSPNDPSGNGSTSGSGGSTQPGGSSSGGGRNPGRGNAAKGRGNAANKGGGNQGREAPPGGSGAPGTGNGNANPGSWAGGGSPGNSGNAPGHNK